MKALIILENGFEDVEALCTYDILKRSGIELVKASLNELNVQTSYGHIINTDCLLKDIQNPEKEFDFLILPGGKAVFNVLDKLFKLVPNSSISLTKDSSCLSEKSRSLIFLDFSHSFSIG